MISVIGVGAGDPDYLTLQAAKAIGASDVFFMLDKGEEKDGLIALRRHLLSRYARPGYRVAVGTDPDRDRTPANYSATIADWRHRRATVTAELIREHLAEDETGAFLVWGDPSLYDSTVAILEDILDRGLVAFSYRVIPGISSVSALAASHRVTLNRVGGAVHITTGRRLAEGLPGNADDVVVMLDANQTFQRFAGEDLDIYWGAYVGTPEEVLRSGKVGEVADDIAAARAEARAEHGWIMDTYLLRRPLR
jgi:precorrin-6A synthase